MEDCGSCNIYFSYNEEELKNHKDERTRLCATCERYMTPDSKEFVYCVAMDH